MQALQGARGLSLIRTLASSSAIVRLSDCRVSSPRREFRTKLPIGTDGWSRLWGDFTVSRPSILLAVLALLSLFAAPTGFMPMRGADGSIVLQICPQTMSGAAPGHEMKMASMDRAMPGPDANGDHRPQDHAAKDNKLCDYALAGIAGLPNPPHMLAVVTGFAVIPARPPIRVLTGIFPRGLPPSTGPPPA